MDIDCPRISHGSAFRSCASAPVISNISRRTNGRIVDRLGSSKYAARLFVVDCDLRPYVFFFAVHVLAILILYVDITINCNLQEIMAT